MQTNVNISALAHGDEGVGEEEVEEVRLSTGIIGVGTTVQRSTSAGTDIPRSLGVSGAAICSAAVVGKEQSCIIGAAGRSAVDIIHG